MTILAAILARFIHCAVILAAAPLLCAFRQGVEARLSGRSAPSPMQAWRDLRRLARKQRTQAESAALPSGTAPTVGFAAAAVAAALVPSFTLGMAFAPFADLLVVAALLASSRMAMVLAALETGTAPAGLAAGRTARLGCLAEPALYLAIFAFGALGGTTNLDVLFGLQRQGALQPVAATVLAVAALALAALSTPGESSLTAEFSGPDLMLARFANALRALTWLSLAIGLLFPFGIAPPEAGPLAWITGLLAWGAKLLALSAILAAPRAVFGDPRPSRRPLALGIAAILGALATILVLASAVAA